MYPMGRTCKNSMGMVLFCCWDLFYQNNGYHHQQNWKNYLYDVIIKMANNAIQLNYIFAYNSASKRDRDDILVSNVYTYVLMDEEFNESTFKALCLLLNVEFKMAAIGPVEITVTLSLRG